MIIILTKKELKIKDGLIINSLVTMIDDYHLILNVKFIEFDYLIIEDLTLVTDLAKTKILIDDDTVVTNFFGQTSIEHIYVGDIDNALDHLYNGE